MKSPTPSTSKMSKAQPTFKCGDVIQVREVPFMKILNNANKRITQLLKIGLDLYLLVSACAKWLVGRWRAFWLCWINGITDDVEIKIHCIKTVLSLTGKLCDWCVNPIPTPEDCTHCISMHYCGSECHQHDIDEGHELECGAIRLMESMNLKFSEAI